MKPPAPVTTTRGECCVVIDGLRMRAADEGAGTSGSMGGMRIGRPGLEAVEAVPPRARAAARPPGRVMTLRYSMSVSTTGLARAPMSNASTSAPATPAGQPGSVSRSIFKAYDIRGIVDETLTEAAVRAIGRVLGARARQAGIASIVVGRDGRLSGPRLALALAEGICASGRRRGRHRHGADADRLLRDRPHRQRVRGVAVTGSHNPPEYNGLKMVIGGRDAPWRRDPPASRDDSDAARAGRGARAAPGRVTRRDIAEDYLKKITGDVKLARPMKIAVDAGNGVAGALAPRLLRAIGCERDRALLRRRRQRSRTTIPIRRIRRTCRT